MLKSYLVAAASLTAISSCVFAQGGAPAQGGSVTTTLSATGDADLQFNRADRSESLSSTSAEFAGEWMMPWQAGSVTMGFEYGTRHFDLDGGSNLPVPDRLTQLNATLSYRRMLDEQWSYFVAGRGGWRNAGTSLDSDALGVSAFVGVGYAFSSTLRVMVGGAYDSLALDEHRFAPGFGLQWQANERWSVDLGFPQTAVSYQASDVLVLSLRAEGHIDSYYTPGESLNGGAQGTQLDGAILEYEDIRVGLGADYQLTQSVTLRASAGAIVRWQLDYPEADAKVEMDGIAPYASVGVVGRF